MSCSILFQVPLPSSCCNHHLHLRGRPISDRLLPTRSSNKLKVDYCLSRRFRLRLLRSLPPSAVGDEQEEEAREAVSEILEEFGVSTEESIQIALKSPNYLKMLTDSVRDLDELSLWNTWRSSSSSINPDSTWSSYKEKVYEMGIAKGDKGMLPLLESVGLSLPSAMNVARYLSSLTPPSLLHQVKYVKEIFFSDSDGKLSIGNTARRIMMQLSIPIDDHVQQTLSFLQKVPLPSSCCNHHLHLRGRPISDRLLPTRSSNKLKVDYCLSRRFRLRLLRSLPPSAVGDEQEEEAREAVSEILEEFGVSTEESIQIALKSPNYLKMLTDSVRDLDELSLWNTWRSSSSSINPDSTWSSYKEKVYEMGIAKGDKGMLPLLESVGLSLPSAMNVARYLSSLTPPSLLHQVKYVKEIFFSDSDGKLSIGNTARRIMMQLSIPIDDHVQQTLSFLQKLRARRGGLDLLGSGDASFQYLIESFPRILLLPIESRMKPMVEFLADTGVPKGCMRNIFLLFPPIVFYDIEKDIKPRMQAFKKVYAGDKEFGRMLLKYPWILSASIQENYEEILAFFEMEKVPEVNVYRAIKSWPLLLGCSIGKMKLMVDQFRELGVNDKMLGQVIATSPQLLMQKPQEIQQIVFFFKDLGLDDTSVGRILGRCPEIFMTSIERTLKKKVEFLCNFGVSKNHLPRVIRKYPELFVCDVNKALLPRMEYMLNMGLTKREIAFMVGRFSPLLGYSIKEVLKPKYEFLVNTMHKPVDEVVEYPRYFSYSLEKRIKPRYLELKDRNFECSLKEMLSKNDDEFAEFIPPP